MVYGMVVVVTVWAVTFGWTTEYADMLQATLLQARACESIVLEEESRACRAASSIELRRLASVRRQALREPVREDDVIQRLCALAKTIVVPDSARQLLYRVARADVEPRLYDFLAGRHVRQELLDSLLSKNVDPLVSTVSIRPLLYCTARYADSMEVVESLPRWRELIGATALPREVRKYVVRKSADHPALHSHEFFIDILRDSSLSDLRGVTRQALLSFLMDGVYDEYAAFVALERTDPELLSSALPACYGALRLREANDHVFHRYGDDDTALRALAGAQKGFDDERVMMALLSIYDKGQGVNASAIAHTIRTCFTEQEAIAAELLSGEAREQVAALQLIQMIPALRGRFDREVGALKHSDNEALAAAAAQTDPPLGLSGPSVVSMLEEEMQERVIEPDVLAEKKAHIEQRENHNHHGPKEKLR
jgi:hypothetical protein